MSIECAPAGPAARRLALALCLVGRRLPPGQDQQDRGRGGEKGEEDVATRRRGEHLRDDKRTTIPLLLFLCCMPFPFLCFVRLLSDKIGFVNYFLGYSPALPWQQDNRQQGISLKTVCETYSKRHSISISPGLFKIN